MNEHPMMKEHLDPNKPKPLSGVTVIDFTRVLSGPTCTMMLADQGARVIKVERPGSGDDTRSLPPFYQDGPDEGVSVYYFYPNRGKESITLDLRDPNDLALVKRMMSQADVVVENFRPGTMAKLGLGPEEMTKQFPKLIYCSISGYGQYGDLSQKPGYDTVIQAVSGIMDATGWPGGPATRVGTSISDLSAGIYAFSAITTALYGREKTGKGTTIDIAMLDCTFALMEHGIMDALGMHVRPTRIGNRHPFMYPFDTFQCADRLLAITVGNDVLFEKLCVALGQSALASDPRYKTDPLRSENCDALKAEMENIMKNNTAQFWKTKLEQAGVPADLVLNIDETRQLPHMQQRGMIQEQSDHSFVPGTPLKFGYYGSLGSLKPAPKLNEHGDAIRKEFAK